MRRGSAFWLLATAASVLLLPAIASAQSSAIERNLPQTPVTTGGEIRVDDPVAGPADETPLGVDVVTIVLIGADADVPATSTGGVIVQDVDVAYRDAARAALAPFLGQPLSQALIARAQTAIAGVWRAKGYPFMSVTIPPQEVTSGTLTLRVVEFVAGTVTSEHSRLPRNIRQQPGEPIAAARLSEDLAWLNRNPFRDVGAVFTPGDRRGTSDIDLTVAAGRPFAAHAGWDSTGSASTGRDRWFIGGGAWMPAFNDMTLAWRYTRSNDLWDGAIASLDPARRGYLSLAGRIDLPTLPRQALSVAPNLVTTNEFVAGTPFSFANLTIELPIHYRTAMSNIVPGRYWGDVYFGAEPKWLRRTTRFAGIDVATGEAALVNLVVGWSHLLTDDRGRTSIDLWLKGNPGGIAGNNTLANWAAFTGGRMSDHTYLYGGFDIGRWTQLSQALSWSSSVSGQVAGQSLPDTERLSLGGHLATRGYDGSTASVDAGFVWRNELRPRPLSLLANAGLADTLSPFAFVDLGWGRDVATRKDSTLAGTGLGFDYAIGTNFTAGATAAMALINAGSTRSGDWTVAAGIRLAY